MANPRRISNTISELPTFSQHLPTILSPQTPNSPPTTLSSLLFFFKRPLAFPFLLTCFLLLTWVSLRLQHPRSLTPSHNQQDHLPDSDDNANLIRFNSETSSQIFKDKRGWLLNPVTAAHQAGISGGARSCSSVHVGQIKPSGVRGNHRHHTCNETLIIWGAKTKFRLENALVSRGYTEVTIDAQEVAVAASPQGTAHALVNVDPLRTTYILGCQDGPLTNNSSTTDYNVWKDLQ